MKENVSKIMVGTILAGLSLPLHAATIRCTAPEWDAVSLNIAGDGSARIDFVITPKLRFAEELQLPSNGVVYPFIKASLAFPKGACQTRSNDPTILRCFTIAPQSTKIDFPREEVSRVLDGARVEITKNHVESIGGTAIFHDVTWQLHDALTGKDIIEARSLECQQE